MNWSRSSFLEFIYPRQPDLASQGLYDFALSPIISNHRQEKGVNFD